MDHTIEVWTQLKNHYAECSCGWKYMSIFLSPMYAAVRVHRKEHEDRGDSTEVV